MFQSNKPLYYFLLNTIINLYKELSKYVTPLGKYSYTVCDHID